jgi:hypothetical protein
MKITTSYDIIKGILNFPQTPTTSKLFDGRRYQLFQNGFMLDAARRGGIGRNTYHLSISNRAGIQPFPDSFDAIGLLPKLVYKILKRRTRYESWGSILPNLSTHSNKQRRLYKKLKKSEGNSTVSASNKSIAKELGGGAIRIITTKYVLDGYTVIAQKHDADCVSRSVYSATINDASLFGKYAKKIYIESFRRRHK